MPESKVIVLEGNECELCGARIRKEDTLCENCERVSELADYGQDYRSDI